MILFVMLLAVLALVVLHTPVAFAIGLASIAAILLSPATSMSIVSDRSLTGMDSFVYTAIPMFILAGNLMEHAGITPRLLALARALVGHIRGGLGMSVVVSEMFFSGISGSTMADVSAMSGMMLPAMRRARYKPEYSVSIVTAASGMGILIPPCNLMVVLGALAGVSVAALFFAGFLPALVLAGLLMITLFVQAVRSDTPADTRASLRQLGKAFVDSLIPMGMPVIIFGGILTGMFTPTEAAAIAVLYAFLVGVFVYRTIRFPELPRILLDTAILTGVVMLLVGLASIMSYIVAVEQVPQLLASAIIGVTDQPWFFLLITALIFITIGSLIDGVPSSLIFVPVLLPITGLVGVDPLHFLIVVVAAVGIGTVIPPFGNALLVACAIGDVPMGRTLRPISVFTLIMMVGLVIVIFVPWITLVVPEALLGY